ncbi:hypothetical protein OS493_013193 [Desmophyllum pertusum]|uniref:Uncharacterized protein n=1 Tax=Desmophyllum pertusum TaxID=174260 RepID=A0A9W9YQ37_9CNID|nr:hypothetical protein OS493_013193 [Desmophyllum pertusum]
MGGFGPRSHHRFIQSIKQPFKSVVETPGFSENKQLQESAKESRSFHPPRVGRFNGCSNRRPGYQDQALFCTSPSRTSFNSPLLFFLCLSIIQIQPMRF